MSGRREAPRQRLFGPAHVLQCRADLARAAVVVRHRLTRELTAVGRRAVKAVEQVAGAIGVALAERGTQPAREVCGALEGVDAVAVADPQDGWRRECAQLADRPVE